MTIVILGSQGKQAVHSALVHKFFAISLILSLRKRAGEPARLLKGWSPTAIDVGFEAVESLRERSVDEFHRSSFPQRLSSSWASCFRQRQSGCDGLVRGIDRHDDSLSLVLPRRHPNRAVSRRHLDFGAVNDELLDRSELPFELIRLGFQPRGGIEQRRTSCPVAGLQQEIQPVYASRDRRPEIGLEALWANAVRPRRLDLFHHDHAVETRSLVGPSLVVHRRRGDLGASCERKRVAEVRVERSVTYAGAQPASYGQEFGKIARSARVVSACQLDPPGSTPEHLMEVSCARCRITLDDVDPDRYHAVDVVLIGAASNHLRHREEGLPVDQVVAVLPGQHRAARLVLCVEGAGGSRGRGDARHSEYSHQQLCDAARQRPHHPSVSSRYESRRLQS